MSKKHFAHFSKGLATVANGVLFLGGHFCQRLAMTMWLKDGTVWPRNSYNLAKKINENNGLVKVVEFEDYGHIDMVAKLAKPLRGNGELLKLMTDFIQNIPATGARIANP